MTNSSSTTKPLVPVVLTDEEARYLLDVLDRHAGIESERRARMHARPKGTHTDEALRESDTTARMAEDIFLATRDALGDRRP